MSIPVEEPDDEKGTKSQPKLIKLNVGGTSFMTFVNTLMPSSYLSNLLDDDSSFKKITINIHEVFIDRSGKLFQHILFYLRTGTMLSQEKAMLERLLVEADFYGLADMEARINDLLRQETMSKKTPKLLWRDPDEMFNLYQSDSLDRRTSYCLTEELPDGIIKKYALVDTVWTKIADRSRRGHVNSYSVGCRLGMISLDD